MQARFLFYFVKIEKKFRFWQKIFVLPLEIK